MNRFLSMPRRGMATLLALITLLFANTAWAVCLSDQPLRGVNLAGAEFNSKSLPGVMHKDYTYPGAGELAYFSEKGATAIRLPVRWERVQHNLFGELDDAEVGAIQKTLNLAEQYDICLILDIHNYGKYRGQTLGSEAVPVEAFVDVWERLASQFDNSDHLALGLMNEPFSPTIATWAAAAQQTVTALRNNGAEHLILVSGGRWSGVHEWFKPYKGSRNSEAFASLKDPLKRTIIEVHQYTDADYSGTNMDECRPPEHFQPMFEAIDEWADENGQRLFLGEFGVPGSSECLAALDAIMAHVDDPGTWRGWAYWAAGRWWGSYPMSVSPRDGEDAPQMEVLEPYLKGWECDGGKGHDCPSTASGVTVKAGS